MISTTMAWRNLLRNRRRTAITVVAVALNTGVLIVSFGLIDGMGEQMVHAATALVVGDAQIHADGYLDDRSIYRSIAEPEKLVARAQESGLRVTSRSYGFGLLSFGSKSAGATFWGVLPVGEQSAFELPTKVVTGAFLAEEAAGGMVLGRRLARSLQAQIGSELVAVVQAADGSMGNELFRVVGTLGPAGEEIDRGAAILHRDDFERLFLTGGRVHEIALRSAEHGAEGSLPSLMGEMPPGIRLQTWRQLLPMLSDMLRLNASSTWLFGLIFFLAAAFGVMNTMLMATHDRVPEFGVQKALGATPWRIVADVVAEALLLSLCATALGAALGLLGAWYLSVHGIDTSSMGGADLSFGGVMFDPIWRATINAGSVVYSVVMMWGICILASLYPAIKVARLDPVHAMTHV